MYFLKNSLTASFIALSSAIIALAPAHGKTTTHIDAKINLHAQKIIASLTVPWVPNAGQWDARVAFRAQTFAGGVWLTRDGALVHEFGERTLRYDWDGSSSKDTRPANGWSIVETFNKVAGATRSLKIEGVDLQPGKVSFHIDDVEKHRDLVSTYGEVRLGEMFPGVSVALRARDNNVEKLYTVAPGRNPSAIRMNLSGASQLSLAPDGALLAHTDVGSIAFTPPVAFQEIDGKRIAVLVRYRLHRHENAYGFEVAAYDPKQPLTIDPLLQSTYLGGDRDDSISAMAIHSTTGEIYVAGNTSSTDFPGVQGGPITTLPNSGSGFVVRFNSMLTTRMQSTYFGGAGGPVGIRALAIHPSGGDVYVTGYVLSPSLPNTSGSVQPNLNGPVDAFVGRFNSALTSLTRVTYLGGSANDQAYAIGIHPVSGEIYVAGETNSTDLLGAVGGAQPSRAGTNGLDAFVSRLSADLSVMQQSTYLGGTAVFDVARAIAFNTLSGSVYVAGDTSSTNFPSTNGGAQPTSTGGDAFVSRLNTALTVLTQSSYLGGIGSDVAQAIAIHPSSGEVYVAGTTRSNDFPGTTGGAQSTFGGELNDGFITRLSADLTQRFQSTYMGGNGRESLYALAIHPISDEIYVAGDTSTAENFPGVSGGAQSVYGGPGTDGFVARFNAALTQRLQSTYLGGTSLDTIGALAIQPTTGGIYVAGRTLSKTLLGTIGGAQPALATQAATSGDGFISVLTAKLDAATCLDVDGDGVANATNDGLLITRALLGMIGTAVTGGAIAPNATRTNWTAVRRHLNAVCGGNFAQ